MRVMYFGNQDNVGYRICSWLRVLHVEADLYIPHGFKQDRCLPEQEDAALLNNYPGWIKTYKRDAFSTFKFPRSLKRIAKSYDILLVTGYYILPALDSGLKILFLPTGTDLSYFPFRFESIKGHILSILYRNNAHKITKILVGQEDCVTAAKVLGLYDRVERFSWPVDISTIHEKMDKDYYAQLCHTYSDYDVIFFNPSRKIIKKQNIAYKGNEKILYAFKNAIQNVKHKKVALVLGTHGDDADEFIRLVHHLGLESYCHYVNHLDARQLHAYFALDRLVVLDEFGYSLYNILGGSSREALSFGTPVISALNVHTSEFKEAVGPNCPVMTAYSISEIEACIQTFLALDQGDWASRRKEILDWSRVYVDKQRGLDQIMKNIKEITQG